LQTEDRSVARDPDRQDYIRPVGGPLNVYGARVVSWTRFMVFLPVLGLFVSSLTLVALATVDAVKIVLGILGGGIELKGILIEFIELADVYLLAIVLYIIALGLFELFIDDRIPLPPWLEIHNLEDLKEKLIGVVVVVLAVFFLGKVIEAKDYQAIMYLGVGIAAVIGVLGYFVGSVLGKKE
jgi:uncharacterized membrane protein YqhA